MPQDDVPSAPAPTQAPPAAGDCARDLWIFGYGSLMWRPGFDHLQAVRARLDGYHRAFCISSTHHRGTAGRPGLVLGLDRGGTCEGAAFQIAAADASAVLAYLRRRELISGVYRETLVRITLLESGNPIVSALAYTAERCHPSYTGRQPLRAQAHQIRGAHGISGENLDYLLATVRHLQRDGIRERNLERLVALSAPHAAHLMGDQPTSISAKPLRQATARLPDHALRLRRVDRVRFLYRMRLEGSLRDNRSLSDLDSPTELDDAVARHVERL